ncbi:lytic transglycosylase domain-containing protein [Tsukamurella soli]|uniref:Transglycosylase SLT domain-containing protein n=1 Tax=Tsukamurella soli TaxID=644556 RepID=A0ABP8KHH0_9ACTN
MRDLPSPSDPGPPTEPPERPRKATSAGSDANGPRAHGRRALVLVGVGAVAALTLVVACSDSGVRLTGAQSHEIAGPQLLDQFSPGMSVITPETTSGPTVTPEIPGGRTDVPLAPDAVHMPAGPLGIPGIAYKAYQSAARRMAAEMPGCGVPWYLIAAIGRIESGHADGGNVDATGRTITPIEGPLLDGSLTGNNIVIASDSGGQVTYARALGPMQFLPSTWALFGADNSGDGKADINNIFDASYATARYLCASGTDLTDEANQRAAVFRYNNSAAYVANVIAWAKAYRDRAIPVGGIPEMTVPIPAPPPPPPPPPRGGNTVLVVACPTTVATSGHPAPGASPATASAPIGSGAARSSTGPSRAVRTTVPGAPPASGTAAAGAPESGAPTTVFTCPAGMSAMAAPSQFQMAGAPPIPGALPVPQQGVPQSSGTPSPPVGPRPSGSHAAPTSIPGTTVPGAPRPDASASSTHAPSGHSRTGHRPYPSVDLPTTTVTPPPR